MKFQILEMRNIIPPRSKRARFDERAQTLLMLLAMDMVPIVRVPV